MLSIRLKTGRSDRGRYLALQDGSYKHDFVLLKGLETHYFTNIPVKSMPEVVWGPKEHVEVLSFGQSPYCPPAQKELDRKLTSSLGVKYLRSIIGVPNKAVVTFPHFPGPGGWEKPYPVLNGEKHFPFEDCLYLSFQDGYFSAGSYMLVDNEGRTLGPRLEDTIREELNKWKILDKRVSFIGGSKGASIAVLQSERFYSSLLFACAPQMEISSYLKKIRVSKFGHRLQSF